MRAAAGTAATCLALAIAVGAGSRATSRALAAGLAGPRAALDGVARHDATLAPLRAVVREGERGGCVASAASEGDSFAKYAVTQYALAPATLVRLDARAVLQHGEAAVRGLPWVVLLDVDEALATEIARAARLSVLQRLDGAVVLAPER